MSGRCDVEWLANVDAYNATVPVEQHVDANAARSIVFWFAADVRGMVALLSDVGAALHGVDAVAVSTWDALPR